MTVPEDISRMPEGDVVADEVLRERIRRLMPAPASTRYEGRVASLLRHPAGVAVVGFILTTLAGGAISFIYQLQAASTQREAAARESRREAAMTTFREVGRLMDRRLFWGSQLYDALSTDTSTTRRQRLAVRFDSTIWAWREGYQTNLAAVCRYFGPESSRILTERIGDKFSRFGSAVRERALSSELAERDLYPMYDSLRTEILQFDMRLVEMIRAGEAGDRAGGACSDAGRPDTTSTRRRTQ